MPEARVAFVGVLPRRGTLLGLDFGLARTGVAVGELETRQANPLTTIRADSSATRLAALQALIDEWRPSALVVGRPCHADGTEHAMTARCHRFANQLRGRFGLPVMEFDERLTSADADAVLKDAGQRDWRKRKSQLDALAAQIILQNFLDAIEHDLP